MKAAIVRKPNHMTLEDIPDPERLKPYQCRVKQLYWMFCNGTDTKVIQGTMSWGIKYPCILGHEVVGEITEVGEKVRNFKVGDRVLSQDPASADVCPEGMFRAWGGFTEQALIADYDAMRADGLKTSFQNRRVFGTDIASHVLPLLVTLAEVKGALSRFVSMEGKRVLILGAGPVGLAFVRLAKLAGARKVVCVDRIAERLVTASGMGANVCLNTSEQSFVEGVEKNVGKVDAAIDAVGLHTMLADLQRVLAPGGAVGIYGVPAGERSASDILITERIPRHWSLHILSCEHGEDHWDYVEDCVRFGFIDPDDFITHEYPMEEIHSAYGVLNDKNTLKVNMRIP